MEEMKEKEQYRQLLKNLPDAFAYYKMLTDHLGTPLDFIFLKVNPAFETVTGFHKEQVLGKKFTEIFPEITSSPFDWIGAYSRVATGYGSIRFERYFEPVGRWYEVIAYSDAPGYFATVFRDITENKRFQNSLQESEENLFVTLQSIGDGVIATGLDGRIRRMNPQAEKLTGWPFREAAGRLLEEVFRIIDIKTGEPVLNPVVHVLKNEKVVKLANDIALLARDGKSHQIADSAAPIRDYAGKITGAVLVFSDVTEQYKTRKALEKSETMYRKIVENISDALVIHNSRGKILDFNEIACKMFGYVHSELLGASLAILHSPKEREQMSRNLTQILQEGNLLFEETLMHKNGSLIPAEVNSKVVSYDGEGLIHGFIRNIAKRKQSQQQIANYTAEMLSLYLELDAEMNKARKIHERTLPKELPQVEGFSFAAHYQPAEKLGGDFYDVMQVGKKLAIYLSDVTGHGVDSAMLSVFVKHTIKGYLTFSAEDKIRPEKILRYLSSEIYQRDLPAEYFICIFLAILDLETMELTYTAAGFQDSPLVRLGNGEQSKLISKGLFLSTAFSEELLNLQENSIRLTPGTTIFFNTDGLTEQNAEGSYYGERLPGVFYQNSHFPPQLLAQAICEDFIEFNEGSSQGNDDITFLIMQMDPSPQKTEQLELTSDFAELSRLREKVSASLGNHNKANLFLACLHELACNAIEHGNRLDREKKVFVEIFITDQFIQGNVRDEGEGFNWREQIIKPLELYGIAERGRGIAIARLCCEKLLYNDKGNRATFVVKL